MDRIRSFLKETVMTIDQNSSVTDAAKKMRDNKISSLLVVGDGVCKGIVTEVDFAKKVIAADLNPKETPISKIMSAPLITLDGNQPMEEAFFQMRKSNIRHILVTDAGKIIGMISIRDCADYFNQKFGRERDPIAEFWTNYESMHGDSAFNYALEKLLRDFRKTLEDSSMTARSIDRKDPPGIIAHSAAEEGHEQLAEILRLTDRR